METIYSIVAFFVTGGAFMYPILFVFAIGASDRDRALHHAHARDEP